jgi:hypothetical protein
MPATRIVSFDRQSLNPGLLAQRVAIVLTLLVITLLTTSCGMPAQAAGSQVAPANNLAVNGTLPFAKINTPYNAVIAVGGGSSPYYFSVKTGALPPGITLHPATGRFSGVPTTPGHYTFEVIVTDAPHLDQGSQQFQVNVGSGTGTQNVAISVSPGNATVTSAQKHQFTASVSGTANSGVTWSASSGSISASGLYTAPTVKSQASTTVTATSVADPTKSASALVTLNPATTQTLSITSSGLAEASQGNPYSEAFSASGGTAPYTWKITGGKPPAGLSVNSGGSIAGTPSAAGTSNFAVTVTDASANTASASFSLTVSAGSNFDGPAELPRATVDSSLADTPAPGSTITVNSGGDLQGALNSANCGDTISLQAGATFSGKFELPAKNCDNGHWIIIRTSSPDSALPAEGQRLTPCYAGVASLVGRPSYSCPNVKNVLAKIQVVSNGDGPIKLAPGANFYRFIGLEVTRLVSTRGSARLITGQGTSDHIIVDRSWLHGQKQDETNLGISLNGMTNAAVVDSYFSDFHCISATGTCTDSHAIAGGCSDTQDGPFKIQDNFIEASSEGILFGGGPATLTPSDIQILNNHFWKPWQWMKGSPNFVGGSDGSPFVVKNHLELKNAVRVLVEANLLENNWGGFSQQGYAILLSPKNQHRPNGTNVCPICQVTDVTVRYARISHAGGGFQMTTALSGNGVNGAPALAGKRWSIHDVVIDDLSTRYVGGGSTFLIMNVWPQNPINSVTINHVTAFPDPTAHMLVVGNIHWTTAPMYGFVFTNNLISTGRYPVWNSGGSSSCAVADLPITTISKCFTTYTFANNALIGTPSAFPASVWPSGNIFPQTADSVDFMNFNNADGGNYELLSGSLYKNKGTDGKDLGADVVGLNAALANVE